MEIRFGDVLLLPTEQGEPLNSLMEKWLGEQGKNFLKLITGNKYIHAGLYIGAPENDKGFYTLEATEHGVWILQRPLRHLDLFDVYRHPEMDNSRRMALEALVRLYFNVPYDFTSLVLNAFVELISFNQEWLERILENVLNYENKTAVICSELVAKMYEHVGITIETRSEFVTPDDLAEHLNRLA